MNDEQSRNPACASHTMQELERVFESMKTDGKTSKYCEPFRIDDGSSFRLKDFDPGEKGDLAKEEAAELLEQRIAQTQEVQEKLYAQDQGAMLLAFQAMDSTGKNRIANHVMSPPTPAPRP